MANSNAFPVIVVILILVVLVAAMIIWRPTITPLEVTPTPTTINTTASTPTPTATEDEKPNQNITITTPQPGQGAGLPLVVEGQARVFENTLQVRLLDSEGEVLVERTVMADAPDIGQFGPYRVELYYPEVTGEAGTVEAFQYSARDGSEIDKVSVPVRFQEVDFTEVEVFYSNRKTDPDMEECDTTYSVTRRIPETVTVARAALEQLLMGPTRGEGEQGSFTNINAGVKINSLVIENGTATVDFNEALDEGVAGSCLVQSIRSQITNTLTQFNSVNDVVISVNGETEDVLQP